MSICTKNFFSDNTPSYFRTKNFDEMKEEIFMHKKNVSYDVILIAVFMLIGGLIIGFILLSSHTGKSVEVRIDGKIQGYYSLNENRTVNISSATGENILVIENGQAYMKDADCPDKLCVRQGPVSKDGQSIICLPHKAVVEVTGNESEKQQNSTDIIVK